jgi:hypothetical protein
VFTKCTIADIISKGGDLVIDKAALRKYIRSNYRTNADFAAVAGISQEYLSTQLCGKKPIGHKVVMALLKLGLADSDIFLPAGVTKRTKRRVNK